MREKLIELLLSVPSTEVIFGKREGKRYTTAWHIANHLIANGVTIQEWIPVTERLPENNTRVVVCYNNPIDGEKTVSSDVFWKGHWVRFGETVTHWMPLPTPPKGE